MSHTTHSEGRNDVYKALSKLFGILLFKKTALTLRSEQTEKSKQGLSPSLCLVWEGF